MANFKCPSCGGKMKGHGTTASGAKRWQCTVCGATSTHAIDNSAKQLDLFLRWLSSKKTQEEMGMPARTFRQYTERFWQIWPVSDVCDEVHHVLYVDGIWLARSAVVLIAATEEHTVGWYLAESENTQSYCDLMSRIAAPDVVVCDGGCGFESAAKLKWPDTRIQRCTYHAFCQTRRYTTSRPRLQAGSELYGIAKDLLHVKSLDEATVWLASFSQWCSRWETFLEEKTYTEGRYEYSHERLRKARSALIKLCNKGTLFTYLDEGLRAAGAVPATNNRMESLNSQIRSMLHAHRGMNVERRIKAVFWWCYLHSECPQSPAEILKTMPTETSIKEAYRRLGKAKEEETGYVQRWGTDVQWSDLHISDPWRSDWD